MTPCFAAMYPEQAGVLHAQRPDRTLQAGAGTGDHDRPTRALVQQHRDRCFAGVEHPGEHDVHRVVPCLHRPRLVADDRQDAGVGQHDVDSAEFGHALIEHRLHCDHVPHVRLQGDDPSVKGLNLLHRLCEVVLGARRISTGGDLLTDVEGHDVRALLREPDGV